MATKADLERYLKNPNVRKMLDLISYTEGTTSNGYATAFGGGKLGSLNDHPRYLKTFKQTDGTTNKTSAAGKYQFLKGTWDGVAKQYGLKDFGPESQDLAAVALLVGNGAIDPLLKGDFTTAVQKSGGAWASLPSSTYKQGKKSWDKVNKFLGGEIDIARTGADTSTIPQLQGVTIPQVALPTLPTAPTPSIPEVAKTNPTESLFQNTAVYTKPNEPTPIVQSVAGLVAPENAGEFDLFSGIAEAGLSPEEEPAVVAVGEALQRAKVKENSRSLLDSNPLIPIIGDLFDKVEV